MECHSVLPHLPIESVDCVVREKPVISSKLGQLNPAQVATVSGQCWWHC